jgi:intracellular sulfur oxidation DsrE/DsrF family protein
MMRGIGNSVRAVAGVVALLIVVPPSAEAQQVQTQPAKQTLKQTSKQASKQTLKRPVAAKKLTLNQPAAEKKSHRLVLQVNVNDPATMNLALNNATNVAQYYKDRDEKVAIEIITFGPGLHMLRDDTSPVKARIKTIKEANPAISFQACGNTQENMHKVENKDIPLVPEATVVKSGVVRVMELQEQGWTYVKP